MIPRALVFALAAAPLAAQAVDTYHNRNLPSECEARMRSYVAAGHRIVCVAFPPAGGNSWTIVTDKTFFNRGVPSECHSKMQEFVNAGHKIVCVAYPPAGGNSWSVITDRSFFNRGIPSECHTQMNTFARASHRVTWVAFPPAGGNSWSVLTNKGFFNRNVPSECHTQMNAFANAGHTVRCVAYPVAGGNRWTVITDKGYFNRGTPTHLHNTMRALARFPGGPVETVAYTPAGDGFTAVSAADPGSIPATITSGNEAFSLDRFAANLQAQILNKGVKGGFAIRYGNAVRSYAVGAKRTQFTPPAQSFSIYDRFNPASVSKVITGVALMRAIQNKGVNIEDKIFRYLPTFWTIPSAVKTINFRELLSHQSGFRDGPGYDYTYNSLRTLVANDILTSNKVRVYANNNFALARILCVYLDGYREAGVTDHAAATAQHFAAFVQKYLMDPCGFPGVQWKPDSVEPTLWFPYPSGLSRGTTYGDWSLKPGSAGVHVSLAELTSFLDQLHGTTSILNAARKREMDTYFLGWDGLASVKNSAFYNKGGYFPASQNGGAELHSWVATFQNGIHVAAVLNSTNDLDIRQAYNAAWAPIQVQISAVTSRIDNVTPSSITVTGSNLDLVRTAYVGNYAISSRDFSDPTQAYIRPLSATTLLVHPPQGIAPGQYGIRVTTGAHTSNTLTTNIVLQRDPRLIINPQPIAGNSFDVFVAKGTVAANFGYLAASPSNQPSVLPGVFDFDIGAGFQLLVFWPIALSFDQTTAALRLRLPSATFLKGEDWYFQFLYGTRTYPLPVSNVGSLKFR